MAISKVIYGGDTLIDITDSTIESSNMLDGTVGYNSAGVRTVGSYVDSDEKVKQTPDTSNNDLRVLLSNSANDTEETNIAKKNTNLKYNPSTGNLQMTKINGVTVGNSPEFTDTKVRQTLDESSDKDKPILLAYSDAGTTTANVDNISYRNNKFLFNLNKIKMTMKPSGGSWKSLVQSPTIHIAKDDVSSAMNLIGGDTKDGRITINTYPGASSGTDNLYFEYWTDAQIAATSGNTPTSRMTWNGETNNLQLTKLNGNTVPTGTAGTIALTSDIPTIPGVVSTSANGLAPKVTDTSGYLKGDGTWGTPTGTYSLPLAASGTRGGIKIGYSENGTNYAVKLSSEKAYVTVPWTDTTYIFAESSNNGKFTVTPSDGGSAQEVPIHGLGTAAYKSIKDTYSGTDGNCISGKGVKAAINGLNGGTIGTGGTGKTITALSQSAGNISATFENISITANQISDTVGFDKGGTGATTRLNAVKALTNENVGTNATFFLTITNSWAKAGYTSVANAKTVLGLGSAAYTESSAYATSSHTHGNITNDGKLSSDTTRGSGDKIVITDSSNSHKVARSDISLSAAVSSQSQTTKFLREDGAWAAPTYTTNAITGVKGNAETNYRTGNVNLTPANIGALALTGGTVTGNTRIARTGTTANVDTYLYLGNSTAAASGGARGLLEMYATNTYRTRIYHNNAPTANRNLYLPNETGTVALTEHFSANNIFDYRQAVPRTNKDVAAGDFTSQGYIQFVGTANGAGANLNQYSMTIPNAKAGDKVTLSYTVISGSFSHTNSSDTTIYILDKNGSAISGSKMSFPASLSQGDTASKTYTLQDSDIDNINNGNLSGASFKGVQIYMRQDDVFTKLVLAIRVHYEDCCFNNEYKPFTKTNSQLTESTKWKTNNSCNITSSSAGVVANASAYDEILIKGEIASSSITGLFVMIHIPIIALTTTNQAFRGGWYQNATGNYGGAIYFNARKNGDSIEVSLYLAYLNGETVTSTSKGTIYYR